jgi:hypothetical protein
MAQNPAILPPISGAQGSKPGMGAESAGGALLSALRRFLCGIHL